ncbi:MAG: hypothetical protein E5X34_12530 [Mesorhizobium sp.]|uniref:ATP-dependent nuclease n=1 Tax=Mesorhizobium sp. TaxID=1871066 RepID=UPI00120B583A|nr:ATP-binding protein [Mesorhizobium sp.]TIR23882.1 MAG: hypothetical protein E5X34_12530 [Mesorhizobium sp.]
MPYSFVHMIFPYPITFSNFRSIATAIQIPFSKKITFVVGPNNVGKSNALRFLAVLFNRAEASLNDTYDFPGTDKAISLSVTADEKYIREKLSGLVNASRYMSFEDIKNINLKYKISKGRFSAEVDSNNELFKTFTDEYFSGYFLHDFGSASSIESNKSTFLNKLSVYDKLSGTTYLPNLRFITQAGQEPPQFVKSPFPGETVAFGTVIKRFAELDRPAYENLETYSGQLKHICDFISFVVDKPSVEVSVPRDNSTLLVRINGETRPLESLGTGIEQLLMIGLVSIGFPNKIVLIDEPELHLHPLAQKRIMKYLNESVDAQFVIATHSAAVLDSVDADIIQLSQDNGKTGGRTIQTNAQKFRAVRDLGHSPSELLQTKFAIWVEGPSDRIYLNSWIKKIDSSLNEGIDYTILFYGGKILSHHSFEDIESDLVKAVTVSRSFAVLIDSDRKPDRPNLNATKSRVKLEVEREGGLCWVTEGREIENYLPRQVIASVAVDVPGVTVQEDKREQILNPEKVNKADFARRAVSIESDEWPLDLKKMVTELVTRIRAAR